MLSKIKLALKWVKALAAAGEAFVKAFGDDKEVTNEK
jgi:hypothetical protein